METNTAARNILEIMHIMIPPAPAVPVSKGSPEIAPPTIAPAKKAISIMAPPAKPIRTPTFALTSPSL